MKCYYCKKEILEDDAQIEDLIDGKNYHFNHYPDKARFGFARLPDNEEKER